MTKKTKFATALLATALLSNGFSLENGEEIITVEPDTTAEVAVEKTSSPITETQHLVAEEEVQVEVFDEVPMEEEVEALPGVATEAKSPPTLEPQQPTPLPEIQADREEPVPQAQEVTATREPTINIPEPDSMNGIDYGTSQTVQPDVPSKPVYTDEQLTDPSQKPDGTPVEVYAPEESFPEERTSTDLAYVPGFGWVPIPEACEVIFADDMYQNGNKVGSMGGG